MSPTSATLYEYLAFNDVDKDATIDEYAYSVVEDQQRKRNETDIDAYVSFVLDETSVSQAIMSCLSITIYDESTPSNTKNYIGKMSVGSVLFGGTATDKVDKPGGAKSVISYIVKIEFEIEEALKSQNITINDYQAVQGNEISNLNLFSLILTSDKPVA